MRNWKTTVCGVAGFVAVLATAIQAALDGDAGTVPQWEIVLAAGAACAGLIFARDAGRAGK